MTIAQGDASAIKSSLSGAKTQDEKLNALLFTRKQIKNNAANLIRRQKDAISSIHKFNTVTKRLEKILNKYTNNDKKASGLRKEKKLLL